jgi:histidinol-phosphate aminotransferase
MEIQIPDYIRTIRPYIPGKPIEETRREYGLKRVIKLASNENPLGPSPRALEAIRKNLKDLGRYPDSSGTQLREALAKHLKFPVSQIALGNGSNELIDLLICACCIPGDAIVTSAAAFVAYKICAQVHGVRTLEAPLRNDLTFDLDAMLTHIRNDSRVRLVFIANPNNPTGTYVADGELRAFLKEVEKVRGGGVLVVLDSAYWEYVTARDLSDASDLVREFSNVISLRTFSKIYGLAGIRVGYWIAPDELTATLNKIREPFNLNSLGLAAAEAALQDKVFVRAARKVNSDGMKEWEKFFKANAIPYWKSQGNFVLIDTQAGFGMGGGEVFEACLAQGVIFRPVANYGLPNCLRISVGTSAENRFAMKVLKSLLTQR